MKRGSCCTASFAAPRQREDRQMGRPFLSLGDSGKEHPEGMKSSSKVMFTSVESAFSLFDFRNGRGPTGDLDSVANNSAKYSASEWRDIGYGTPCGFCFILTAECLRPAVIAPHSHCGPELYFTSIGCWLDDFCGRSSCIPVSKFALGCCDRCPVVFSYRSFGCCFKTAKCPLDRSKPSSACGARNVGPRATGAVTGASLPRNGRGRRVTPRSSSGSCAANFVIKCRASLTGRAASQV
jgi:hypothetical protein